MKGLGFGLERMGIAALTRPLLFSLFLVLATFVAVLSIPNVKFNGNVTAAIPQTSINYINYQKQKQDFRDFTRDIAVIVRSPRLLTAAGLEDLRFMQLELAITDGVNSAVSMFSIPDPDRETGEISQFFSGDLASDSEAAATIARLTSRYPQARSLVSVKDNTAIIVISLDIGISAGNDKAAYAAFDKMREAAEAVAPEDFELYYSGLTPIGLTILDTLIDDQVRLTLVGLSMGALIAMIFFRSVVAAFLCFIPPLLTAIWSIGLFAIVGVPITYLTTILPALALVLAYADGIVLYHRWVKLNGDWPNIGKDELIANLREAILRVGPASALTSITTAFAISSFAASQSEALFEFAWLGVILVSFAFVNVIIALPILGLALIRIGWIRGGRGSFSRYSFGRLATRLYGKFPYTISVVATLFSIALFYVHNALEPNYNIVEYLPRTSETLEAENIANDVFGGRSLVFLSVPVAEEGGLTSAANRERLGEVTELLERNYDPQQVFSIHSIWKDTSEQARTAMVERLDELDPTTRQGYLSKDGTRMLVSLRLSSDRSIVQLGELTDELRQTITSNLDYGEEIVLTGFPVLLAIEFTKMINELRWSLLVAVFLGVVLIGVATRSVFFAAAAAIPNLFPILLVELFIYLNGGNINVTEVVALTLAFGIAIDNAVHVINVFHAERKSGKGIKTALENSVREVAPALGASTLIICISNIAILTSVLPILPIIGKLIIAILVVALFTNLVILPANILTLSRVFKR